jgi:DNA-binding response OmpR family regulator
MEAVCQRKKEELLKQPVLELSEFRKLKTSLKPKNILVVDDEASIRHSLKRILENSDYNVLLASEGSELSAITGVNDISLILLDINLPWIDGYELCKLIKENALLKEIPVIFISGYNSKDHIKRGFTVGCDDYITKPFHIDDVLTTVKTLLKINEK